MAVASIPSSLPLTPLVREAIEIAQELRIPYVLMDERYDQPTPSYADSIEMRSYLIACFKLKPKPSCQKPSLARIKYEVMDNIPFKYAISIPSTTSPEQRTFIEWATGSRETAHPEVMIEGLKEHLKDHADCSRCQNTTEKMLMLAKHLGSIVCQAQSQGIDEASLKLATRMITECAARREPLFTEEQLQRMGMNLSTPIWSAEPTPLATPLHFMMRQESTAPYVEAESEWIKRPSSVYKRDRLAAALKSPLGFRQRSLMRSGSTGDVIIEDKIPALEGRISSLVRDEMAELTFRGTSAATPIDELAGDIDAARKEMVTPEVVKILPTGGSPPDKRTTLLHPTPTKIPTSPKK
jgi:hypothetical protein